jgi:hypothetical protein
MLKLAHLNTSDALQHNIQMWPVTTEKAQQTPHNSDATLDPSQASSTTEHNTKRNETNTNDTNNEVNNDSDAYNSPDDELDLYFKAYVRNPPAINESNAESAERTTRLETDFTCMKKQRQERRTHRRNNKLRKMITPAEEYTPLPATYDAFLANPEPYRSHPMWDLLSPIEYYAHKDAIDKKDQNEHSNKHARIHTRH